jgi:peptidoglycan/xylan/chitin deacetylase (PgdA/CDA1 family)
MLVESGNVCGQQPVSKRTVFLSVLALAGANAPAVAAQCPSNADALGTSRILTLSFDQLSQVGSMQYKGILPLKDHEVILTFDDGPLPPYTNVILDTLASHCVKATYFVVGQMARSYPYLVRRIYNAGHTVGTHSLDHPLAFERLAPARVKQEVDGGIAYVDTAIGDPRAVAPFFRIPGFKRSNAIDNFLKSRLLVNWSADIVADDWFKGITPQQIVQRAMQRLEAKGRGILLLHDIHPATAMALPALLKELKERGYRVVHVRPARAMPKSVPPLPAPVAAANSTWPRLR